MYFIRTEIWRQSLNASQNQLFKDVLKMTGCEYLEGPKDNVCHRPWFTQQIYTLVRTITLSSVTFLCMHVRKLPPFLIRATNLRTALFPTFVHFPLQVYCFTQQFMVSVVVARLILSHRLLPLPSSMFFWYRVIVARNHLLCFERIRIRFIIIDLLIYLFLATLVTARIKQLIWIMYWLLSHSQVPVFSQTPLLVLDYSLSHNSPTSLRNVNLNWYRTSTVLKFYLKSSGITGTCHYMPLLPKHRTEF